MYTDEMQGTERCEQEFHMETKEESGKGKKIGLIIFLAFLLFYAPVQYLGMYRLLAEHKLPQGAEIVFGPKIGMVDCCSGCRLAIEEVYRIPMEQINKSSFGKTYGPNGDLVVETLGAREGIEQSGVRFLGDCESDCIYIYHYYDLQKLEGYRENDGYCYIHVWGRKYIGSESGLASILMCFSSVLGPFIALPVLFVILIKDMIKWILKKKRKI